MLTASVTSRAVVSGFWAMVLTTGEGSHSNLLSAHHVGGTQASNLGDQGSSPCARANHGRLTQSEIGDLPANRVQLLISRELCRSRDAG